MVIVTQNGVAYRTRATSKLAAARLCEALEQKPDAEVWGIQRSERAKSEDQDTGWFVLWVPTDEAARAALVEEQQFQRVERAKAEGDRYTFVQCQQDGRTWAYCQSTSGEVYEVTLQGCTCDDWQKTAVHLAIFCKHQWALIDRLQRGDDLTQF